jgi:4-hydroxy-tetrahydrodipicolinate reductase
MKVGIAGISGRVGRLLAGFVVSEGHELAGGTRRDGPGIADIAARSDVVIDFSHAAAVARHAASLAASGTPWVLGTTGLDEAAQRAVDAAAARIAIVQAANFSPGVVIATDLARRLAALLPAARYDAEILERHHRGKRDAPSGTALALGRAVAAGRGQTLDPLAIRARDGETGPRPPGAIGFAVQRGGAVVGEHQVSFTSDGERITLTHEAFDRSAFAEGALRAAVWLQGRPPGAYAFADVLGLSSDP